MRTCQIFDDDILIRIDSPEYEEYKNLLMDIIGTVYEFRLGDVKRLLKPTMYHRIEVS